MKNTGSELIGGRDKITGVICEDQEGCEYGVYLPDALDLIGELTDENNLSFRPTDILKISERAQGKKKVRLVMWVE